MRSGARDVIATAGTGKLPTLQHGGREGGSSTSTAAFHSFGNILDHDEETPFLGRPTALSRAVLLLVGAAAAMAGASFWCSQLWAKLRYAASGDGADLLILQGVEFKLVSMGTCQDNGFLPILQANLCDKAAMQLFLQLTEQRKAQVTHLHNRPEGCYMLTNMADHTNTLWLSAENVNVGLGADTSNRPAGKLRQPICVHYGANARVAAAVQSPPSEDNSTPPSGLFLPTGQSSGVPPPTDVASRPASSSSSTGFSLARAEVTLTHAFHKAATVASGQPLPGPASTYPESDGRQLTQPPSDGILTTRPPDVQHPSSCTAPRQNCQTTRCCEEAGTFCFEKDVYWASCEPVCEGKHGWTCRNIDRNPSNNDGDSAGASISRISSAALEPAAQKLECSWSGSDCSHTMLCCVWGAQCVRKNAVEAVCIHGTVDPSWDGAVLGKWRQPHVINPAPFRKLGDQALTLFCITVYTVGSAGEQLVESARKLGASVFACDDYALFQLEVSAIQPCGRIAGTPGVVKDRDHDAFTVATYEKVWTSMKEHKGYLQSDWIVKVDPDIVFFPLRLRKRLWLLRPPADTALYFKGANKSFGFLGAIEVVSKNAMHAFFLHQNSCKRALHDCFPENRFLQLCLDMVGAGNMVDDSLLDQSAWNTCSSHVHTAFHTSGGQPAWEDCYEKVRAQENSAIAAERKLLESKEGSSQGYDTLLLNNLSLPQSWKARASSPEQAEG